METDLDSVLRPLMESRGITVSPLEFHRAVNVAFHDAESACYDDIHKHMWETLPEQFSLIGGDVLGAGLGSDALSVLDVGCGTGLSSELLLRTGLGGKIARIDLIDTSPGMLSKCSRRASTWGVDHDLIEGTADRLVGKKYDLILCSSVLHHIIDLRSFLSTISSLQSPGGFFFHVHDPNGDYLRHPALIRRTAELRESIAGQAPPKAPRRSLLGIIRKVVGRAPVDYIDAVNRTLIGRQIIRSPLTDEEIWSVTDIHDVGLPYSFDDGISIGQIASILDRYTLVRARSYGFFGRFPSELPGEFRDRDRSLVEAGSMEGKFVGASWRMGP